MGTNRRAFLRGIGAAAGAATLAGCTGGNGSLVPTNTGTNADADTAVAAQWNTYRAALDDAAALAAAGEFDAAAAVAERSFARFESATGEYGAHERLEATSEERYAGFEEELGLVRENADRADLAEVREARGQGSGHLAAAQRALAGQGTSRAFDLQRLGSRAANARLLADAGEFEAAATVAAGTATAFEESDAHGALESAASEQYEAFERGLGAIERHAKAEDAEGVRSAVGATRDAANRGAAAIADGTVAATGALAGLQARGFDAAALAGLGGPATSYAHAATLTTYRSQAFDARRLAARGDAEAAATAVADVFAHFEGAQAHEALEGRDHEAYEAFEAGLESLRSAIEAGDAEGMDDALAQVDAALVAGVDALATGTEAAVLEASFFRARVADARLRYESGDRGGAAGIARDLFERFERDEGGFHETFESADHEAYEAFESHLGALQSAAADGADDEVAAHATATLDVLLNFEATVGGTAVVGGAEAGYVAARAFDAAALATAGATDRAAGVVEDAFAHFEAGAGGFHEALEDADHDRYESFEAALSAVGTAAAEDGDVGAAAKRFDAEAIAAVYAVVGDAGGDFSAAAGDLAGDVVADFEDAAVHDRLEAASTAAYEGFEDALADFVEAVKSGNGVDAALSAFVRASVRAQFALVGALDEVPVDDAGSGEGGEGGADGEEGEGNEESAYAGGPNVVDGVPDDADHVVEMKAVSFAPDSLTVQRGDTVAFEHVGGDVHTVTADGDGLPEGADYWNSAGATTEEEALESWDEKKGAVRSGQSYVHTFETAGTHEYYCIPHEAAGMTGTITVEE